MSLSPRQQKLLDDVHLIMDVAEIAIIEGNEVAYIKLLEQATHKLRLVSALGKDNGACGIHNDNGLLF